MFVLDICQVVHLFVHLLVILSGRQLHIKVGEQTEHDKNLDIHQSFVLNLFVIAHISVTTYQILFITGS